MICDLREVWRESWSHLDQTRDRQQAILRETPVNLDARCLVDPFRLGQVFRNILENALAAAPVPTVIEISMTAASLDGQPALQIAFRDHGPGIPVEQRTKIFDPFFTTKSKGTGLGLAIAKRIVEAHGGQIAVCGADGPGALFVITIPKGIP